MNNRSIEATAPCRQLLVLMSLLTMTPAAFGQYQRGANVSGAEFGQTSLPGIYNRDYTFNSELIYRYLAARNLGLIRLPLQWERLQPVLGGPLDPSYLALLQTAVSWAAADGNQVILDVHNFGFYSLNENGKLVAYQIDQLYSGATKVTRAHLADLWVKLSRQFSGNPAVYAYDLMNEPHGSGPNSTMPGWQDVSQYVLTAIRNAGDNKLIMIPGNSWSSANRWLTVHGPAAWIADPANNFMYEAHLYFDSDESGTYVKTWDAELAANSALATVGSTRVAHFIAWCRNNNVRGYLGEFGVPASDPRWLSVLDDFLSSVDAAGMSATIWAAGEWWGNYALSVQPTNSFMLDRPQTSVLLRHLPAGLFNSVSAAGNTGSTFAPESFMAGYGVGMGDSPSVELTRSDGATLNAPVNYASPTQINYLIPAGTPLGRVNVAVRSQGAIVARGTYVLEKVAPTLFTFDGSATGTAAAGILRIHADGTQSNELTNRPIDFGDPADQLFLTLYGTGFRNASAPSSAVLTAGGKRLAITYFGPQPNSPGLDQINAVLPASLAHAGVVSVTLMVDGKTANPPSLLFQ